MGAAGGTSAEAWAQALRSLAAAAATAESTPAARAAAAELLVAWIDARVVAEGEGAWETRALAAAASELVEMDDPALAPAVTALASPRATADPAAVVDAILLGRIVPHADAVAEDDVKVRLPAWTPRGIDSERVRGVSRANEDRLRRWATAWMRDALTSAESLLAKGGGRADESAYVSAGGERRRREARPPPPIRSRASSNRRRVRRRFPCPRTCSGSSRRSRPNARGSRRARNRRASGLSGMGGFAADVFAARWKNIASGLGGVSPATSRKERRRMRATGTSSADEEPATSPATEPGDGARHASSPPCFARRKRLRRFDATETVTGDGDGDGEPEETPTDRRGERLGGEFGGLPPVPMDATETPAATVGGFFRREHIDVDSVEEEKREAREEAHEEEEDVYVRAWWTPRGRSGRARRGSRSRAAFPFRADRRRGRERRGRGPSHREHG